MHPIMEIPIGRGLGLVLAALAVLLAWWNPAVVRDAEGGVGVSGRQLALGSGVLGVGLLALGEVAVFPWPTYGLMMGIGTVSATFIAMSWCLRRGISGEVVIEFALIGFAAGLIGGRVVHLLENWDTRFGAQPASLGLSLDPDQPLSPGDELVLRTLRGDATVRFEGDERSYPALAERLREPLRPLGIEVELIRTLHRGAGGVEEHLRGVRLRSEERGEAARLEVVQRVALSKLGLQAGFAFGSPAHPWTVVFDIANGGLTFFGAVIGILLAWSGWIVYRGLPFWTILDAGAPVFPWGTFWGRLGCLGKGCCWGREAGEGALIAVDYPPWSLPWYQLAGEQVSCRHDGALAEGDMTPALREALGSLAEGTPSLHATQLYEALGALAIFAAVLLYQRFGQRKAGQSFALLVLLMCPVRWIDEHFRRDHDYFFDLLPGYPLTVTQLSSGLLFLGGVGLMIWLSRRGEPLEAGLARLQPTKGEEEVEEGH